MTGITSDDMDECWCCSGLHDSPGTLCPDCDDAGCNRFSDDCKSDHQPAMADGGVERRDPADDPAACSVCGVHIGFFGDEYCDGCARDVGAKPPLARCLECGQTGSQDQMDSVDISPADEYYPTIRYLCRSCSGGESA